MFTSRKKKSDGDDRTANITELLETNFLESSPVFIEGFFKKRELRHKKDIVFLQKLDKKILDISLSTPTRWLENFKTKMYDLFEINETEKILLDKIFQPKLLKIKEEDIENSHSNIIEIYTASEQANQIKCEFLVSEVELDLKLEEYISIGFEKELERECQRLAESYRRHKLLLNNFLDSCDYYRCTLKSLLRAQLAVRSTESVKVHGFSRKQRKIH